MNDYPGAGYPGEYFANETEDVIGTIGATFPGFTADLSGILTEAPVGTIAADFPHMTAQLAGATADVGYISAALPHMTAALLGFQAMATDLTATFPSFTAALEGWTTVSGSMDAAFPHMTATITGSGPLSSTAVRVISKMYGVFLHNPFWPGERRYEITSWHNLNRSWQRFQAGNADVDVANVEADDNAAFIEGYLLVCVFEHTPVWAGPVITFSRENTSGITRLDALGLASLLDGQDAQQAVHYRHSVGSGGVFRDVLASVNRLAHTGIHRGHVENGPAIKDLQVGGQSAWQSFEELQKRTNLEYWVDIEASPAYLKARLNWATRQGLDLSASVHLWEGVHFGKLVYKRDMSQEKAAQTAMGDFGARLAERNSVTVLASGKKANNGAALRRSLASMPPGLRNTRVFHVPMTGNTDELEREARRAFVRPLNSSRSFNLEIPKDVVEWEDLQVGNYVSVHPIATPDAIVRVVGFSPDEERGVLEIVGEEAIL